MEASIGLVEDHRALFESATHWVTKRRRDEEVRKKQGELVSSGGRGSMLYRPLDDIQWADEFFSEEGLQERLRSGGQEWAMGRGAWGPQSPSMSGAHPGPTVVESGPAPSRSSREKEWTS